MTDRSGAEPVRPAASRLTEMSQSDWHHRTPSG